MKTKEEIAILKAGRFYDLLGLQTYPLDILLLIFRKQYVEAHLIDRKNADVDKGVAIAPKRELAPYTIPKVEIASLKHFLVFVTDIKAKTFL